MKEKVCRKCHFRICRCEDLAAGFTLQGHDPKCWPMRSDALACHPNQIPEMIERNKRHGITGVTYDVDGTAVLADRRARKGLMQLEGVHDNHGGYGDDHAGESPFYREPEMPDYSHLDEACGSPGIEVCDKPTRPKFFRTS